MTTPKPRRTIDMASIMAAARRQDAPEPEPAPSPTPPAEAPPAAAHAPLPAPVHVAPPPVVAAAPPVGVPVAAQASMHLPEVRGARQGSRVRMKHLQLPITVPLHAALEAWCRTRGRQMSDVQAEALGRFIVEERVMEDPVVAATLKAMGFE